MVRLFPPSIPSSLVLAACLVLAGCRPEYREDLDYSYAIQQRWPAEELLGGEIVQFASVPWNPDDAVSLRERIAEDQIASGRDVLVIGVGTGLTAILCDQFGAIRVVAIDRHAAAVANARYNAAMLHVDDHIEVRRIPGGSGGPFAAVGPGEQFDLALTEANSVIPGDTAIGRRGDGDSTPGEADAGAVADPVAGFLDRLGGHLHRGGRCLVVCSTTDSIRAFRRAATAQGFEAAILDERDPETLPADFAPGLLIELRIQPPTVRPPASIRPLQK